MNLQNNANSTNFFRVKLVDIVVIGCDLLLDEGT